MFISILEEPRPKQKSSLLQGEVVETSSEYLELGFGC